MGWSGVYSRWEAMAGCVDKQGCVKHDLFVLHVVDLTMLTHKKYNTDVRLAFYRTHRVMSQHRWVLWNGSWFYALNHWQANSFRPNNPPVGTMGTLYLIKYVHGLIWPISFKVVSPHNINLERRSANRVHNAWCVIFTIQVCLSKKIHILLRIYANLKVKNVAIRYGRREARFFNSQKTSHSLSVSSL